MILKKTILDYNRNGNCCWPKTGQMLSADNVQNYWNLFLELHLDIQIERIKYIFAKSKTEIEL